MESGWEQMPETGGELGILLALSWAWYPADKLGVPFPVPSHWSCCWRAGKEKHRPASTSATAFKSTGWSLITFSLLVHRCGGWGRGCPHAMMGCGGQRTTLRSRFFHRVGRSGIELRSSDLCVDACWTILQTQSKSFFFSKSCCTYGSQEKRWVVDSLLLP